MDSALGSLNASILFTSKRSDLKFTDSSGKIAVDTGPCPNEETDTHSPKLTFKFVSLVFPQNSTDELNYKKDEHLLFITEDFNTSLFERKRKNINWEREDNLSKGGVSAKSQIREVICF